MRAVVAVLLVALAAAGCRGPAPGRGAAGSCTRLQSERQVRGDAICEDVWTCVRPPNGRFDRVGLRRVARCRGDGGPVVLYLPGMHMNAELPAVSPANDLRLYLAVAGFRVWGLDYRSHAVPPDAPPAEQADLAAWSGDVYAEDVAWAIGFIRNGDPGAFFLSGFSYGAGLAYRVAARGVPVDGLVILDGAATGGTAPSEGPPAIDVGGTRLPYETRAALLRQVRRNPGGSSPVEGYRTAGEALADVLYTAPSFGGQGGLSNAKGGVSDVAVIADLLASYDRWWPRAVLGAPAATPPARPIPVVAFAGGQMGEAWVERVRASAQAFAGGRAELHVLPGHGHLDVLAGKQAVQQVYEPARAWIMRTATAR